MLNRNKKTNKCQRFSEGRLDWDTGWNLRQSSVNQFWFRKSQRWPALLQFWLSTVHYLKTSEQRWRINQDFLRNSAVSRSADFFYSGTEQIWFLLDSGKHFSFTFQGFQIISTYLNSEAQSSDFQPTLEKQVNKKSICSILTGQKYLAKTQDFVSGNEVTELFQNFWSIFSFSVMKNFGKSFRKLVFCSDLQKKIVKSTFLNSWKAILMAILCVFINFWLLCHILIFSSTCVDMRAVSEKVSAESAQLSAEKPTFRAKKISAEQSRFRPDFLKQHCSVRVSSAIFRSVERWFTWNQSWSALKER